MGALIGALVGAGVSLIVAGGLYYSCDRRNRRGARSSATAPAPPVARPVPQGPPVQFLAILNPGEDPEHVSSATEMISIAKPISTERTESNSTV